MYLTPNPNGTSRDELVEQRRGLSNAIRELEQQLAEVWPNARDYQLVPSNYVHDRAAWEAFVLTLHHFRAKLVAEAYEIEQQGGGR